MVATDLNDRRGWASDMPCDLAPTCSILAQKGGPWLRTVHDSDNHDVRWAPETDREGSGNHGWPTGLGAAPSRTGSNTIFLGYPSEFLSAPTLLGASGAGAQCVHCVHECRTATPGECEGSLARVLQTQLPTRGPREHKGPAWSHWDRKGPKKSLI